MHTINIILTEILIKHLFPRKSVCCLHHCHKVADGAYYFPLSNVLSFLMHLLRTSNLVSEGHHTERTVLEVGISTSDETDGISLHRSSGSRDY